MLMDMWEYMSDNFYSPVRKELFLLLLPSLNKDAWKRDSHDIIYVLPVAQSVLAAQPLNSGEEDSPAGDWTCDLPIMSLALYR